MAETEIEFFRGDRFQIDLTVKDTDEVTPYDLTGGTLTFTYKRDKDDADADAIFQLDAAPNVFITDAVNGEATIIILPADTDGIDDRDNLCGHYDIQLSYAGDATKVFTLMYGPMTLMQDVTRD